MDSEQMSPLVGRWLGRCGTLGGGWAVQVCTTHQVGCLVGKWVHGWVGGSVDLHIVGRAGG